MSLTDIVNPTVLDTIKAKLLTVMQNVYYGIAEEIEPISLWDYIVFNRDSISRNDNRTGFTDYFAVHIVCENWIPDETIDSVIEVMESIAGMRLANSEISFSYSEKPNTRAVIEIASLRFCKPRKR